MNDLVTIDHADIVQAIPPDQNAAVVYLASLGSEASRRTMAQALDVIAATVRPGATHRTFPWGNLRYQHTQAIRAKLAERYSAASANKCLAALRSGRNSATAPSGCR